jgi:hypothetical protein
MEWTLPLGLNVIQSLLIYLAWRKVGPEYKPLRDPALFLMIVTGSSVIWSLYGAYHFNNWYWGLAA